MKRKSSQKCVLPGKVLVLSLLILNTINEKIT